MDDIGIYPRSNNVELTTNQMNDTDFRNLVRSLNKEQWQFFNHVLHSVKVSDDQLSLFLSGGAGVGKSWVTNALYEAVTKYLNHVVGENPDEAKVIKLAPTGKAAYNIRGNTVHSGLQLPVNKGFHYIPLDNDRLNTIRSKLRKLKVVLIDEISMVGSGMFNFVNLRLQQIMGSKMPFGGVSIIAVGDLFQLQPVFDKWIFENSNKDYGPLALNVWQEYFEMYELTQIMRQKEDKQFAELLNRLREGHHSQNDIEQLKTRILQPNCRNSNVTHLFTTNKSVAAHNNKTFTCCNDDKAEIEAVDIVVGDISDDKKQQFKQRISSDSTKTMGLHSVLSVATSAKYDLTTNVSVNDGMTNGSECTICEIDYRVLNSSRPSIIWVLFSEPNVGQNCRNEKSHLYNTHVQRHWTPILEITRQFKIGKSTNVKVLRRQFPLRPAAAKTIHRCQGDTLDEAVVDFPNSTREHMHYVGLSRVRNIDKLHILNLSENKIRVNPKVKEEMARLRSKCKLVPCVPDLTAVSYTKTLKILFHNVRSLHLHISDISNDFDVQATDISIFVETALCARDTDEEYKIDGFDLFRNDHIHLENNIRTTYGTITYLKSTLAYLVPPFSYNYNNMEISVTVVNEPVPNLHIVGIYRSRSKVKLHKLIEALDYLHMTLLVNKPTILLGDFNIDLLKPSSERKALMRNMIECRGYSQLISQFTTDNRTCIDHIYTNIPHVVHSSGTLESYFSDHKPIFVCLQLMH
jgi:hypothetical protein